MYYGYNFNAKGGIINRHYMTDTEEAVIEHKFDWVDMWNILNPKEQDQVAMDFPKMEDEPPKVIPPKVIKPTFQKYPTTDRPVEIKDRLYANTIQSKDLTELYNGFSGNGKLHDLEFKDFDNFHDFTKAKQEFELGQFYTPDWLCKSIVELCSI